MNQTLTRIRACTVAVSASLALVTAQAGGAIAQTQAVAHATTVDVPCSVSDLVEAINTANGSLGADTLRLARKCTYKLMSVSTSLGSSARSSFGSMGGLEGACGEGVRAPVAR
ncbi:hypothetical protein ABT150_53925 [Streptomyces mirabilis]|uniref:hypothetical protein n=1 Tax=Streptomyces mirabilis TaxID=68239 RepID=UPI0033229459